jgi:hypothetical protein
VNPTAPSGVVVLKFAGPGRQDAEKVLTLNFSEVATKSAAVTPPLPPSAARPARPSSRHHLSGPGSYDWVFHENEGYGELAFGDGDPVDGVSLLGLTCPPGTGSMEIVDVSARRVTLSAGGHTQSYAVETLIPPENLVLQAFRATNALTRIDSRKTSQFPAKEAGRKDIGRFFTYCATHARADRKP